MFHKIICFIGFVLLIINNNKSAKGLRINKLPKWNSNTDKVQEKPQTYVDVSSLIDTNIKNGTNIGPKLRHNLPECATQQVCNALFIRMNHTQQLCECSTNFNWECSVDPNSDDGHTIELTRRYDKKVYTHVKLCEPLISVRTCKTPTDWTLLALQSERSGKAHYVVVCRCPDSAQFEGPYTHNHPPYARVPGIRVYGMLCNQGARNKKNNNNENKVLLAQESSDEYPAFPWDLAYAVINSTALQGLW